jgi:acylphosphatase
MVNKLGFHCYVSGKVQGVWFRSSTKEKADLWSVTGWARNLPDGRVEVTAYGDKANLTQLYEWLHKGPRLSEVTDVTYEEIAWQEYDGFQVL